MLDTCLKFIKSGWFLFLMGEVVALAIIFFVMVGVTRSFVSGVEAASAHDGLSKRMAAVEEVVKQFNVYKTKVDKLEADRVAQPEKGKKTK